MGNMSKQLSCSSVNTQPCNTRWTPPSEKDGGNLAKVQRNCRDSNNLRNDVSEELYGIGTICLKKKKLKGYYPCVPRVVHGQEKPAALLLKQEVKKKTVYFSVCPNHVRPPKDCLPLVASWSANPEFLWVVEYSVGVEERLIFFFFNFKQEKGLSSFSWSCNFLPVDQVMEPFWKSFLDVEGESRILHSIFGSLAKVLKCSTSLLPWDGCSHGKPVDSVTESCRQSLKTVIPIRNGLFPFPINL